MSDETRETFCEAVANLNAFLAQPMPSTPRDTDPDVDNTSDQE